jgi:hypothetical protein
MLNDSISFDSTGDKEDFVFDVLDDRNQGDHRLSNHTSSPPNNSEGEVAPTMTTPTPIRRTSSAGISNEEHESSFFFTAWTMIHQIQSMTNGTVLLGSVAAGVGCCLVATMLYSYSINNTSRTVNARLDHLTETQRMSLQLLHQSIQSLQSSVVNHHGHGYNNNNNSNGVGGDDSSTTISSSNTHHRAFLDEFQTSTTDIFSSSGRSFWTALVFVTCTVFIIGLIIDRRFLQPVRQVSTIGVHGKLSKSPKDAPGSNTRSTTRRLATTRFPSDSSCDNPNVEEGVERKRPRKRSVSFGRTFGDDDSPIDEESKRVTILTRTPTPPAPLAGVPCMSPTRKTAASKTTKRATRSPASILKSPASTNATGGIPIVGAFGPKFNNNNSKTNDAAQSAVHLRLAIEDQQLLMSQKKKSSPQLFASTTSPSVHSPFETSQIWYESSLKTPPQEPASSRMSPITLSEAKRSFVSVSRSIFNMIPDLTTGHQLVGDKMGIHNNKDDDDDDDDDDTAGWIEPPTTTKKEALNVIKSRLAMEDRLLNANNSNNKKKVNGSCHDSPLKDKHQHGVTKIADTTTTPTTTKKSPARVGAIEVQTAPTQTTKTKKEDLNIIRARVREQFMSPSTTTTSTPSSQKKKVAATQAQQSIVKNAQSVACSTPHGGPQQKMMSPLQSSSSSSPSSVLSSSNTKEKKPSTATSNSPITTSGSAQKQRKLEAIRAQVRNNQHLLGR